MLRNVEGAIQKFVLVFLVLLAIFVLVEGVKEKRSIEDVPIVTSTTNTQDFFYGYCSSKLNVREKMSISSKWISQYPSYSTILVLEDLGDWYRIENGFVKKEFVYDSVNISERGSVIADSLLYGEPDSATAVIGTILKDEVHTFVQKKNGFLELENGGWILENSVTFDFSEIYNYPPSQFSEMDMNVWNMPNLRIRYIGALSKRIRANCVTGSGSLYFKDSIPVYDIIDGFAYFPSGQKIYRLEASAFSNFYQVGPEYVNLDAYRTVYYSSGKGRRHNIELVSSIINGTIVESGKTFSFNKTTGARSEGKGYQIAPVIKNGEYVDDFGGGVCQVSSTIYAAIKNDPNISVTQRQKHGLVVSYIPNDMDATVSYGSIDLKFVNNYPFDIKINVYARSGVCMVVLEKVN